MLISKLKSMDKSNALSLADVFHVHILGSRVDHRLNSDCYFNWLMKCLGILRGKRGRNGVNVYAVGDPVLHQLFYSDNTGKTDKGWR